MGEGLKKQDFWPLILLVAFIIGTDFVTKAWSQHAFFLEPERFPLVLFSDFLGIRAQLTYAVNSGAAWGIFADFPTLLVAFRIILILCLIIYLAAYNSKKSWQIPLACIIAGALGNVIDYFLYGYVIDMIQVNLWGYDYPVFNIADSSIFISAVYILCRTFFEKTPSDTTIV